MRPHFHPSLVNDPFGDPALYVEFTRYGGEEERLRREAEDAFAS